MARLQNPIPETHMDGVHPKLRNIQMSRLDCKYIHAPYPDILEGEGQKEGIKLNMESRLLLKVRNRAQGYYFF